MKSGYTIAAFLLCLTVSAKAAEQREYQKNPFPGKIFAAEIVLHYADEIKLTPKQRENVMLEVAEAKQSISATQDRYKRSMEELGTLLGRHPTNEDDARRKLEEVFGHEQRVKIAQWTMMVRIKNLLSEEQREALAKASRNFDPKRLAMPDELRQRLTAKMQKLQTGIRELTELGVEPTPIGELMKPFQSLLSGGRFKEAETLLDQALKKLDKPF